MTGLLLLLLAAPLWAATPCDDKVRAMSWGDESVSEKDGACFWKKVEALGLGSTGWRDLELRCSLMEKHMDGLLKECADERRKKELEAARKKAETMSEKGALQGAKDIKELKGSDADKAGKLGTMYEKSREGAEDARDTRPGSRLEQAAPGGGQLRGAASLKRLIRQDLAAESIPLPTKRVSAAELKRRGWSEQNIRDLTPVLEGARAGASKISSQPTYWSSKLGGNGTVANIENSFTGRVTNGCRSYQWETYDAMPKRTSLVVTPVAMGRVVEHHALAVHPDGKFEQAVFVDGWIDQTSHPDKMVFKDRAEWEGRLGIYKLVSGLRKEDLD